MCLKNSHYQSEYLVPSMAVALDSEKTSNTSFPPQLVESESSCTDRIPHSAFPVMGSTGIRRRNRTWRTRSCPWLELLPEPLLCPNPEPACPEPLNPEAPNPEDPNPELPIPFDAPPSPVDGTIDCPGVVAPGIPAPGWETISTPFTSVSRSGG